MSAEYLDREGVARLLDERADDLYGLALHLTRDPDEAADLLQTVFEKFLQQVDRGRIVSETAMGYLVRMLRNELIGLRRSPAVARRTSLPDELPDDSRARKVDALSLEIRTVLVDLVTSEQLAEEVQAVLRDRFLLGYDIATLCERSGRSRSTVQRLLSRGVDYLMREFEKRGLSPGELD